jgi:hypothetical protein
MTDPFELLSVSEFAARLGGVAPENVRLLEQGGALFAVVPPGQQSGRAYPAFQAWPSLAGDPLKQILDALGEFGDTSPYSFS